MKIIPSPAPQLASEELERPPNWGSFDSLQKMIRIREKNVETLELRFP